MDSGEDGRLQPRERGLEETTSQGLDLSLWPPGRGGPTLCRPSCPASRGALQHPPETEAAGGAGRGRGRVHGNGGCRIRGRGALSRCLRGRQASGASLADCPQAGGGPFPGCPLPSTRAVTAANDSAVFTGPSPGPGEVRIPPQLPFWRTRRRINRQKRENWKRGGCPAGAVGQHTADVWLRFEEGVGIQEARE